MSPRVAGSLWSVPLPGLMAAAHRLAAAGLDRLHWDRSDGVLGPEGGFDAATAAGITADAGLAAEAHLMVAHPLTELDPWTDFCEIVVVHAESEQWRAAMARIERRGARPAVALGPGTPVNRVAASDPDVLVMSVRPGHGGSAFLPGTETRVRALAPGRRLLGVDGGVDRAAAHRARAAGATWLVVGTALLASPDPGRFLASIAAPPPG